VQVDPIKPTLKAPGTKCLKLKHVTLFSSFAFKIDVRRYTKVSLGVSAVLTELAENPARVEAGAYTRPLFSST